MSNLTTLIMAAGKGKRMKNPDKSKVMHEINGRPLIEYVVELALSVGSDAVVPIVGHQKDSVIEFLKIRFEDQKDKLKFAHQDEQLGTGHAVMMAKEFLTGDDRNILILSGDVPLLRKETIESFRQFHEEGGFDASLISAVMEDPSGYGRVLRDESGNFTGIKEHKDCTEEEKKCREINSGIYIIGNKILLEALQTLKTDNAQGEYYLTDVFPYFKSTGRKIGAFIVDDLAEISGINTIEQLESLERQYFSGQPNN